MLPLKRVEECRRTNAKFIVYNTHAMMSWQNKKINQLRLPLHSCYSLIHEVLFDIRGPSWTADGERVPRLLVGCQSSSDVCVCVCVCVCFEGENAQGTRGDDVHAMKDRRMTQVLLPLCTIHDVGGDLRNMTVFIFWKAGFIELHREQ